MSCDFFPAVNVGISAVFCFIQFSDVSSHFCGACVGSFPSQGATQVYPQYINHRFSELRQLTYHINHLHIDIYIYILVGGLEHDFYFSIY